MTSVDFEHLTAAEARTHRTEVEDIYRGAYVDAIRAGAPFTDPVAFMQRFDAYTAPNRPGEFEQIIVSISGRPVGQVWGWSLSKETAWWNGLQLDEPQVHDDFTVEDGTRTFALSELMVKKDMTGRGLARTLHNSLLRSRPEQRATLLVRPDNTRAYQTYLRWGWYRVGRLRPGWPDAPQFDVLIHDLRQ
ncbi:GNAT family N-acetyltransferase [Nocardia sp. NPDC004151]|uniref:GNAT family N-acetyltransferase n=1 Tax=Nocardia sp. NPDC004151 TaxID=3364304 RepID=UPI0036CD3DF0